MLKQPLSNSLSLETQVNRSHPHSNRHPHIEIQVRLHCPHFSEFSRPQLADVDTDLKEMMKYNLSKKVEGM